MLGQGIFYSGKLLEWQMKHRIMENNEELKEK
jgi:hypothetical protein